MYLPIQRTVIAYVFKQHKYKFQTIIRNYAESLLFQFVGLFGDYFINLPGVSTTNNKFISNLTQLKTFRNILCKIFHILCFSWSNSFELVGYNFDLQKKLKKNLIKLGVGFSKYKVLTQFESSTKVLGKKRYFTLFSSSINSFYISIVFFLHLRNIFPYKKRGLVPAEIPVSWMKPGKKTKYK
jgi:hypothetical protein